MQLPICSKLAINLKNDNNTIICWYDIIINFFCYCPAFLSTLVTGPSFMSISLLVLQLWQFSFIRDWPEIQKLEIPVWVFPNILGLGWVRNTKFGTNVCKEMLLNAAKCQGYSFYCFWVLKGKPTGGKGGKITPPTQIRVKYRNHQWDLPTIWKTRLLQTHTEKFS